eukprot:jgi/Bigna1/139354/aug1.50_g14062
MKERGDLETQHNDNYKLAKTRSFLFPDERIDAFKKCCDENEHVLGDNIRIVGTRKSKVFSRIIIAICLKQLMIALGIVMEKKKNLDKNDIGILDRTNDSKKYDTWQNLLPLAKLPDRCYISSKTFKEAKDHLERYSK